MGMGLATMFIIIFAVTPMYARADTLNRQLELGMSGADVSALQAFLAKDATLYPQGLVTGYFGMLTQSAVSNFQARNGIDNIGRVGPVTLIALNAQMLGGIGGTTDKGAPIMSEESVNVSGRNATISWNTSEPAQGRVMYGTNYPYLYAIAPSSSDYSMNTATAVTLSSLLPNTTYYYVRESTDISGNVMLTTYRTFQTGQ